MSFSDCNPFAAIDSENESVDDEDNKCTVQEHCTDHNEGAWKPPHVVGVDIIVGLDVWSEMIMPPIPDVPCYNCRSRTHLQSICPLLLCSNCFRHGHHTRCCQMAR